MNGWPVNGWTYEQVQAHLQAQVLQAEALGRIAVGLEELNDTVREALKLGGPVNGIAVGLTRLTDAVNRNTTMGGSR